MDEKVFNTLQNQIVKKTLPGGKLFPIKTRCLRQKMDSKDKSYKYNYSISHFISTLKRIQKVEIHFDLLTNYGERGARESFRC